MDKHPLHHGLPLFNSGRFFEAHEALEDVWREAPRRSLLRRHLQGLVQLAVAFHHQSRGNLVGARSVLERAIRNLAGAEESFPEVDWEDLHTSLEPWREFLAAGQRKAAGSLPAVLASSAPLLPSSSSVRPSSPVISRSSPPLPKVLLRNRVGKGSC